MASQSAAPAAAASDDDVVVAETKTIIDLSQLLSVTVATKPLELVLQTVLKRLDALEARSAADGHALDGLAKTLSNQVAGLNDSVAALREESAKPQDGKDAARDASAADANALEAKTVRDDLNALKAALSDLQQQPVSKAAADDSRPKSNARDADGGPAPPRETHDAKLNALAARVDELERDRDAAAAAADAAQRRLDDAERRLHGLDEKAAAGEQGDAALRRGLDALAAAATEPAPAATAAASRAVAGHQGGTQAAELQALRDDLAALKARVAALAQTHEPRRPSHHGAGADGAPPPAPALDALDAMHRLQDALEAMHEDVELLKQQQQQRADNGREPAAAAAEGDASSNNNNSGGSKERDGGAHDDVWPAIRELKAAVERHGGEIKALGNECSRNADECQRLQDRKADKEEPAALRGGAGSRNQSANNSTTGFGAAAPLPAADHSRQLADLIRRADDCQRAVERLDGAKADVGTVDALAAELALLRGRQQGQQPLHSANASGAPATPRLSIGGAGGGEPQQQQLEKAVVAEVTRQVGGLAEAQAATQGHVVEIRATIEHIHHSKADAALVANKAERDYVENAMEKLMREVEAVLNATNAGLVDTLDKSLHILRDMIDGKATKQDVTKLQALIRDDAAGSVPEGLTGFKGYRCLGCNRVVDGMRQRPMGGNFASFMNRLPNAPRQAASSHGPRGAAAAVTAPAPPAGYIANAPAQASST